MNFLINLWASFLAAVKTHVSLGFVLLTKLWNILDLAMRLSHDATHTEAEVRVNPSIWKRPGHLFLEFQISPPSIMFTIQPIM